MTPPTDCVAWSPTEPPVTLPLSSKVMVPNVVGGAPSTLPPLPDGTSAGSPVRLSTSTSGSIGTPEPSSSSSTAADWLASAGGGAGVAGADATLLSVGVPASVFLPSSSWKRNSLSSCIFRICSCICRIWKFSSSMVPERERICSSSAVMRGSPACAIWIWPAGLSLPPKSFGRPILGSDSPLSAVSDLSTFRSPTRSSAWTIVPDTNRIASVPLRMDRKYMGVSTMERNIWRKGCASRLLEQDETSAKFCLHGPVNEKGGRNGRLSIEV